MKKILLTALLFLSLMVCFTSPAWAGGVDDAKAGLAAFQERNYNEAIRLVTKAIASGELSREQLWGVYQLRGLVWSDKGDYDKAIVDYTEAIEIDPKNAIAYYSRGNAWAAKGDYDKAIADFTEAIDLEPKFSFAYFNRGNAWDKKGNHDKAKADYAKAKELGYK